MQLLAWEKSLKCSVSISFKLSNHVVKFCSILLRPFVFILVSWFKGVRSGWGLHWILVWCAILYWVSVSILETRKAIRIYLIFSSLFCRHVCNLFCNYKLFVHIYFWQATSSCLDFADTQDCNLCSLLKLCKMANMKSSVGIFCIFSSIRCLWAVTSVSWQDKGHARFLSLPLDCHKCGILCIYISHKTHLP